MVENPFESPQSQNSEAGKEPGPVGKSKPKRLSPIWWAVGGAMWLWLSGNYFVTFWNEPVFQSFFWYGSAFLLLAIFHFWLAMAGSLVKRRV